MIKDAAFADIENKNTNPTLTIIIATYNAGTYIETCLKSIIENVKTTYQLIIVDGLSADNTLSLISKYEEHVDTLISEKDHGIYDAMNKAVTYIKGKWVLFLGADDRLLPTFNQMENFLIEENTIYYGNGKNKNHLLGGAFTKYQVAKKNLCHQCIFYPKAVFNKYQYSLSYPVFADYLLNIQCWGDNDFKKVYKNVDITYYNMEGFSSYAEDKLFRQDKPKLVKQYLGNIVYIRYMIRKFKESKKADSKFF
ncbi:glycosyltransferase [Pedobacter panaciterrae]|uniref:Glycosyltransferase n=1 Tax=Pedobacter panaciterrae TaxID=363849 RepID=A0ABU8NUE6_9SPHI|nr:glycosyltransferase [uncultured Pedobacter sp.]